MPEEVFVGERTFANFCDTATEYWRGNTVPAGASDPVILVEAMTQDPRVTLRNLSIANGLRRIMPARVVVIGGVDEDWSEHIWSFYDRHALDALCRAYGAADVVDVHHLVDLRLAGNLPPQMSVAGTAVPSAPPPQPRLSADRIDEIAAASTCRVLRVPSLSTRLPDGSATSRKYAEVRDRSQALAEVCDALMLGLQPLAFITSHVDYNVWGLAVLSAMHCDVPVIHMQSTGSLKAYTHFGGRGGVQKTYRRQLTRDIGAYFDKRVWHNRETLKRGAELVLQRDRGARGRPTWWRGGAIEVGNATERLEIRAYVMARCGFDEDKPVLTVFNHAVSDALGTNVEAFDSLSQWFAQTVEYAAARTDVNWLLVDHPKQYLYDQTGFFESLAREYSRHGHLAFMPSLELSKTALIALTDLAITVRGSISNELPAYGIPAIQAGWSEWSDCGFTTVAETPDDYWKVIDGAVAALFAGERLISEEQVDRARLWAWFYRSGADVPSRLIQHWSVGRGDAWLRLLTTNMQEVEADADPLFTSVRRMWLRREPLLTRVDLSLPPAQLADALGVLEQQ